MLPQFFSSSPPKQSALRSHTLLRGIHSSRKSSHPNSFSAQTSENKNKEINVFQRKFKKLYTNVTDKHRLSYQVK